MLTFNAYAATSPSEPLVPTTITRRDVGPRDVLIEIAYAGVCHSDIHTVRGDWGPITYPQVFGHEVAGTVVEVGPDVTKHAVGDRVGVGTIVNSCRECDNCRAGEEQYCLRGNTQAYCSVDRDGTITQGGYSSHVVVDEDYVLRLPATLDFSKVAPLLRRRRILRDQRPRQLRPPREQLRPDHQHRLSHPVDLNAHLRLLRRNGTLVSVGAPSEPLPIAVFSLFGNRRSFAGSSTGGLAETQEMLDFCAEQSIVPETELIDVSAINDAYERVLRSDVRYRFVIDAISLHAAS